MRKAFLFLILILLLPTALSSTFNREISLDTGTWQQISAGMDCYENSDTIQLINDNVVLITLRCKTYNEDLDIMPFEISVAGGYPNQTLNFPEQRHSEQMLFDSKIFIDLFFDECNINDCVHVNELKISLPINILPKLKAFVANENAKTIQEKMEGQRPEPTATVVKTFYISELNPDQQDFAEEIECVERKCSIEFVGKEHGEKIIVLDIGEVYDKAGGVAGWTSFWGGHVPGIKLVGSADFDTKVLGKLDETINFAEDTVENWRTHASSGVQLNLYLDHFSVYEGTYVQQVKIRLGQDYVDILKKYYELIPPPNAETGDVKIDFKDWISQLEGKVSNPIAKINTALTVKEEGTTSGEISHEVSGANFIILKDVKVGSKYILNIASIKVGDKYVNSVTGTSDEIKEENLIIGGV